MSPGIEMEVVYWDIHLVECRFTCSNGRFSGCASIYINHDTFSEMANQLRGFPSHIGDIRNLELGTFNPEHADGGIRLHFYCTDSVGHVAVNVQLRGDACRAMGEVESVAMRIPLEAAAIDRFVAQLQKMRADDGSKAVLANWV